MGGWSNLFIAFSYISGGFVYSDETISFHPKQDVSDSVSFKLVALDGTQGSYDLFNRRIEKEEQLMDLADSSDHAGNIIELEIQVISDS